MRFGDSAEGRERPLASSAGPGGGSPTGVPRWSQQGVGELVQGRGGQEAAPFAASVRCRDGSSGKSQPAPWKTPGE